MRTINTANESPKIEVFMREEKDSNACVRILEGKFSGIVFSFGVVSVGNKNEEDEEGTLPVNYTYDIVEGVVADSDAVEFEDVTASILYKLVTDFLDDEIEDEADFNE